jgi:hypothetical protein
MKAALLAIMLLLMCAAAQAHIGSPDVYFDGNAGPYQLFVTIRPPVVIPGVAEIEVRAAPGVRTIHITPMPLSGPGAKFAPTPDVAKRAKADPQFFTGSLWMMTTGSWQVRVEADGDKGKGILSVPVPATATQTKSMAFALGAGLFVLMLILAGGVVSIAGAAVREGNLEPGVAPPPSNHQDAYLAMAVAALVVILAVWGGNNWWTAEASSYSRHLYKPLSMSASVDAFGKLDLQLHDPGWLPGRRLDDFVPDHGHLMHLYAIRWPEMDEVWHLHPEMTATGEFTHMLPKMPAGAYSLFADVVHANGFPETMMAQLNLQADLPGKPLQGDDAGGSVPPLSQTAQDSTVSQLPGGWRMRWVRDEKPLKAKRATLFAFRLEDKDGKPAEDMELYMGMPGHAAFVKTDGSVFAHVHPSGSVAMPALMMAQSQLSGSAGMPAMGDMAGMTMNLPATVTFPYGFPQPGEYRIFVQVKHGGRVETGVFNAQVE